MSLAEILRDHTPDQNLEKVLGLLHHAYMMSWGQTQRVGRDLEGCELDNISKPIRDYMLPDESQQRIKMLLRAAMRCFIKAARREVVLPAKCPEWERQLSNWK